MYKKTRICECCGKELTYGSYSAWHLAEKNHGLCRSCAERKKAKRLNNLSILLEDTPETCYWIGFLLADGHFDNGKRIIVGLAEHDRDHLEKFAKYIGYKGTISLIKKGPYSAVRLSAMDTEVVGKLCEKFGIENNKTYNPPASLSWIPEDLFLCLLAGLIDGDGNISNFRGRKDAFIRIKQEKSWLPILKEFAKYFKEEDRVKINKQGYAEVEITGFPKIRELKKKLLEYNLPLMDRKWGKIDIGFQTKYEKKEKAYRKIKELLAQKIKQTEIAKMVGVSESTVTKVKKQIQNEEK